MNEKEDYFYSIGGGVHHGETAEDAVRREVFEETGDLSSIHISEDLRNRGIGRTLFLAAKQWAVWKPKFIIKNMWKQNRMIVS